MTGDVASAGVGDDQLLLASGTITAGSWEGRGKGACMHAYVKKVGNCTPKCQSHPCPRHPTRAKAVVKPAVY